MRKEKCHEEKEVKRELIWKEKNTNKYFLFHLYHINVINIVKVCFIDLYCIVLYPN